MGRLLIFVLGIISSLPSFAGSNQDSSSFCNKATGRVDTLICKDVSLNQLRIKVDNLHERLKQNLKVEPLSLSMLNDTVQPYVIERNACNNETLVAKISQCARSLMEKRLAILEATLDNSTAIEKAVEQSRFISIDFLHKYQSKIVGNRVQLNGLMTLHKEGEDYFGEISSEKTKAAVRVQFKSLPEQNVNFLREKKPHAWWEGTVLEKEKKNQLFIDTLLGQKLPDSSVAQAKNGSSIQVQPGPIDLYKTGDKWDVDKCIWNDPPKRVLEKTKSSKENFKDGVFCIVADFDGNGSLDFAFWGELYSPGPQIAHTRDNLVIMFDGDKIIFEKTLEKRAILLKYGPLKQKGHFGEPATDLPGLVEPGEGDSTDIFLWDRNKKGFVHTEYASEDN